MGACLTMLSMRLETGIALAALGLHAMFIVYLVSFYYALSRPIDIGNIITQPYQLVFVGMFLFALPGFGLAGVAYILAKRDAPKTVAVILIAQGVLMPAGMFYTYTLTDTINEDYRIFDILIIPQIFLAIGFAPIPLGIHIAKLKPVKKRYM